MRSVAEVSVGAPVILVVDDLPFVRQTVRLVLEPHGYEVVEAADGAAALTLVRDRAPALVLLDLGLTDTDGFELAARIRERGGERMRLLVFADFVTRDDPRATAIGFDDVITKPIEPSHLATTVESHVPPPQRDTMLGQGKHVVLACSEEHDGDRLRQLLEPMGFLVHVATGRSHAFALVRSIRPHIVLACASPETLTFVRQVRDDSYVSTLPIVLVSDDAPTETERARAIAAGADALVQLGGDGAGLAAALREALLAPAAWASQGREPEPRPTPRRGIGLLSGQGNRSAALSAQLMVLSRISEAMLRQRSVDESLDQALTACFDAGGIPAGALVVRERRGDLRVRALGMAASWDPRRRNQLCTQIGHVAIELVDQREPINWPSRSWPDSDAILATANAGSAFVVPLRSGVTALGALVIFAREGVLDDPDWRLFAQGVGAQITLALALADVFAEKVAAEERALASRAEWQALAEDVPDLVVRIDRGGTIRYTNRTPPGHERETLLGSSWLRLLAAEAQAALSSHFTSLLAAGAPVTFEARAARTQGDAEVWYSGNLGPIREGGRVDGAVLVLRDVTQRRQADAKLVVSDRLVSLGTLSGGIAHEINNPLAAVIANLDLARRMDVSSEMEELLAEASEAAERVRRIVRDLKLFSRVTDERHGAVDVVEVLSSTVRLAWNEIRHRARLVRDLQPIAAVDANESRLGQVFLNLLVNAAQAIPEGRASEHEITVRTRMDGTQVVVEISDTGVGMSAATQARLFTPFFTTKPIGVGTGLGLPICQRIVTSLGGEIRVRSTEGRGSTFEVRLPKSAHDVNRPSPPAPPPEQAQTARRGRVLVIDDDASVATVIRRVLAREHDVVMLHSADEALAQLAAGERFDVVLCDLMMPQTTGMDFHDRVVEKHPDLLHRVVYLTGGAFTQRARLFLDTVPNERLEKPIDLATLRAVVRRHVGRD